MPRFTARHPFYLIRHGQTDWNAEGRFQGSVDIPLNARGRTQARRNGQALKADLPDAAGWAFISSPLSRARETMEIVRGEAGMDPFAYQLQPLLAEVTYGDWERHTLAELSSSVPELIAERASNKWGFVPPNGESYAMLAERVCVALAALEGPSVITAHGGVLRAVFHMIGGMEAEEAAISEVPQDRFLHVNGVVLRWV